MDDLISRQAAIDFIDAGRLCNPNEPRWSDNEVVNFLKSRPSAQPETHEKRTETHACDLIDRDEAIMAVKMGALSAATLYGRTDEGSTALYETVRAIKAIPSAQPERKKGKGRWNAYYHGEENGKSIFSYSCNQCGYSAPYNLIGGVYEQRRWNFCPNCGADMRGEQDEID